MQPLLVSTSAIELAAETVALILRIDDIQVSFPLVAPRARKANRGCHVVHSISANWNERYIVVYSDTSRQSLRHFAKRQNSDISLRLSLARLSP